MKEPIPLHAIKRTTGKREDHHPSLSIRQQLLDERVPIVVMEDCRPPTVVFLVFFFYDGPILDHRPVVHDGPVVIFLLDGGGRGDAERHRGCTGADAPAAETRIGLRLVQVVDNLAEGDVDLVQGVTARRIGEQL